MKKYFIAGTDTDVGKTFVTCGLLHALRQQGCVTIGLKPIAAGCIQTEQGLRNEDALALQKAMSLDLSYDEVNPIALQPPIAPHIALAEAGLEVSGEQLAEACRKTFHYTADIALVEGAGGWRVPLNSNETMAAIPIRLGMPVILVVGLKLGCINHALLTAQAIQDDQLPLVGWVANVIDPSMERLQENIDALVQRMPAPLLASIPRLEDASDAAGLFDLAPLL